MLEEALPGLSVEWKPIPSAEEVNEAVRDGGLDLGVGPPTGVPAGARGRAAGPAALRRLGAAVRGRRAGGLRSLGGAQEVGPGRRPGLVEPRSGGAPARGPAGAGRSGALDGQHRWSGRTSRRCRPSSSAKTSRPTSRSRRSWSWSWRGPARSAWSTVATCSAGCRRRRWSTACRRSASARRRSSPPSPRRWPRLRVWRSADPVGTARLLTEAEELRAPPERIGEILARSGWQLGPRLAAWSRIAELWRRTDRLRQAPASWAELAFDGVQGEY